VPRRSPMGNLPELHENQWSAELLKTIDSRR
jgi:hypothetical protein